MERVVRERMTTQDVEAITPQTLINIRPVVASIKEFFGTSQLSQFMDQTNPLAGLTHKRRLSALGPGGLSRDRASLEVRDVHPRHYGRMCPIETPEGPNIGLIGSLATFARVNPFGFIETPYRKVEDGSVTDEIDYLTADEEDRYIIAQANAKHRRDRPFTEDRVLVRRKGGEVDQVTPAEVEYMDVSPRQTVSVATAMIPFLEHDEANRALMGANMQRQSVPLLRSEAPLVGTGMELRAAVDAGDVVIAEKSGVVEEVTADYVSVMADDGSHRTYRLHKFRRSNQGTSFNQKPIVDEGAAGRGRPGHRRRSVHRGRRDGARQEPAGRVHAVGGPQLRGRDHPVSQRIVQDDVLTSIHIEEHEIDARDTKLGPEEITRDIPNVSEEVLADLDERGIIRIGAEVQDGDILVGKVTPKGETELTPEERLLRAIFGEKAREVRDTSLKVPHGETGKVIGIRVFNREDGDELPPGRERAGPRLRGPEAQDPGRRQARRPARQQGRHRQDPAGRGHAVPAGRHPGRHRAQPARRAAPDERRPDPGDTPRLGRQAGLERRGRTGLGPEPPGRSPRQRRAVHQRRHAGVRRCHRGGDRRPARLDDPDPGRRATGRHRRQGARCSTAAPASRSRTRWRSATCTSSSCSTWWTTRSTPGPPVRTR